MKYLTKKEVIYERHIMKSTPPKPLLLWGRGTSPWMME